MVGAVVAVGVAMAAVGMVTAMVVERVMVAGMGTVVTYPAAAREAGTAAVDSLYMAPPEDSMEVAAMVDQQATVTVRVVSTLTVSVGRQATAAVVEVRLVTTTAAVEDRAALGDRAVTVGRLATVTVALVAQLGMAAGRPATMMGNKVPAVSAMVARRVMVAVASVGLQAIAVMRGSTVDRWASMVMAKVVVGRWALVMAVSTVGRRVSMAAHMRDLLASMAVVLGGLLATTPVDLEDLQGSTAAVMVDQPATMAEATADQAAMTVAVSVVALLASKVASTVALGVTTATPAVTADRAVMVGQVDSMGMDMVAMGMLVVGAAVVVEDLMGRQAPTGRVVPVGRAVDQWVHGPVAWVAVQELASVTQTDGRRRRARA
jgi:hypothetical protein